MPDRQLGVRVPEEIANEIEDIVEKLNKKFSKSFSTSDVLRSAIEEYLKQGKEKEKNIFVKLPCHLEMKVQEASALLEGMKHIQRIIQTESVNEAVKKFEERLEYAEFLDWKAKKQAKEGGE